jgi:hypothetical protein
VGPWGTFDINGFVLIFYAIFALTLGIALGTVIGRVVPAMGAFIPLFIITRLLLFALRPTFLPPMTVIWDYRGENPIDAQTQDWIVGWELLDPSGRPDREMAILTLCQSTGMVIPTPGFRVDLDPGFECLREHGYSLMTKYQPVQRFWLFQAIESGVFLLLSVGLLGSSIWWLRTKRV